MTSFFDKEKWRAELAELIQSSPWNESADNNDKVDSLVEYVERAYAEGRASHDDTLSKLEAIEQRAASALQSMLYTPPWGESQAVFATLIQRIGEQLDAMKVALAAAQETP